MAIVNLKFNDMLPPACRGGVVTIGNFDGVHRGHAALLAELRNRACLLKCPAVAMTFDPHPLLLLRPEQFQPVLTTIRDRAELLQACGADQVVILGTSLDMLRLSAQEFFNQVIRDRMAAKSVVEGVNFGFGRDRQGNVETLRRLCGQWKMDFVIVPAFSSPDGVPVSSSRVRSALLQGNIRQTCDLLARPYRLRGMVGTGKGRGKTLGFPTANLERVETLIPGDGVYAVRVFHGGEALPGAANIGPNPTFDELARKIEVHLIGFQGELVGQELALDFIDRLRDTRPFAGVEQLVQQLKKDIEAARQLVPDV
jgi:riboflavin kinase/FMN adenylyltransferase